MNKNRKSILKNIRNVWKGIFKGELNSTGKGKQEKTIWLEDLPLFPVSNE